MMNKKSRRNLAVVRFLLAAFVLAAQAMAVSAQTHVENPVLKGFNPDPSICVVDSDYYLVTSSFAFVPGLPVYHSRDLVHWELVSHGIDRQNVDRFHFEGIDDNFGVWAPTIRYHDGLFYIVCTMWRSGGNFFITSRDPRGPWSDPVWIPGAQGIDPTLFWDEDGRSYYIGNRYDFKSQWTGQVGVWMQEIDLQNVGTSIVSEPKTGLRFEAPCVKLVGDWTMLTYGHANNARYGEGAHLYKIGKTYYLLMAEGGSGGQHAVTVHASDKLTGPYKAQYVNPVLSHRQMGNAYPIQNIGHADLFRAADGQFYAVCLGNRMLKDEDGRWKSPLGRETFLVKVEQQDGQLIFAPGVGHVELGMDCPWQPWQPSLPQEEPWYSLRGFPSGLPSSSGTGGVKTLPLQPEVLDSLATPACLLQKPHGFQWAFSRDVTFTTTKGNEWAGLTLYRTANSYYTLLKGKDVVRLTKREKGQSVVVAEQPCTDKTVRLTIEADSMRLRFLIGGQPMAPVQSMRPLCDDGKYNKFNGLGVGVYATSMGQESAGQAIIQDVASDSKQQGLPSRRDNLWQSFLTPPDSVKVGCYYYWVNEHVDPKGVKADLQYMKDNGITLAFLATDIRNRTRWEKPWEGETFGKNKFQSKLWWKNLRTALKTAGELDIEMGIFNCPGWSQSGGPWIKPEEAMRNWTPDGVEICKTKQGTDVSCGPCSEEAEGLEVDKLSKTHVQKHFESFIGDILRRIPAKERRTLTTVVVDSWERGKQNYTDSIYVLFERRFGYPLDYADEACHKDLDRLISELVASEYMGGLTEKAHEYGLRTWCEPYAHSPFPGNSITYGSAADEVAAEFWVNDRKFRQKEVNAALGAARRSGKNRVWAESFTDGGWDEVAQDDWSFEKLKPIADRYFHAGINATILHVMISQPGDDRKPAVRPWFGTFFDRRSQHAADLKPLVTYLRRCNFMLQLGKPLGNATDSRVMEDGTIVRFTAESLFEVTFPDGHQETWNPASP